MTHIYAVQNPVAKRSRARVAIINDVKLLRKFEGPRLIEEKIANDMALLHSMWFSLSRKEKQI